MLFLHPEKLTSLWREHKLIKFWNFNLQLLWYNVLYSTELKPVGFLFYFSPHLQYAISESSLNSGSKRVKVQNHSYENLFRLQVHANQSHFHKIGFALIDSCWNRGTRELGNGL